MSGTEPPLTPTAGAFVDAVVRAFDEALYMADDAVARAREAEESEAFARRRAAGESPFPFPLRAPHLAAAGWDDEFECPALVVRPAAAEVVRGGARDGEVVTPGVDGFDLNILRAGLEPLFKDQEVYLEAPEAGGAAWTVRVRAEPHPAAHAAFAEALRPLLDAELAGLVRAGHAPDAPIPEWLDEWVTWMEAPRPGDDSQEAFRDVVLRFRLGADPGAPRRSPVEGRHLAPA